MHRAATPELPRFQQTQRAFVAHLRTPQQAPAPHDVAPRRIALYRELLLANITEQLSAAFPVLHAITTAADWQALCSDFFANHRCASPLFHQLPQEFLHWLEEEREPGASDPPYRLELAHYEWVELALSLAEAELPASAPLPEPLLSWRPRLSPLAWPLAYRFAVHRIADQQAEPAPQATWLLVYRDRHHRIGFMELNAMTARLLQLLAHHAGASVAQLLTLLADELRDRERHGVQQGGVELLQQLHRHDILY